MTDAESEEEFDPHSVEHISSGDWEDVLDRFTQDMDPWAIDIVTLADRYKQYIERLERFDLEVPGRVILIGAVLLRLKAEVLRDAHIETESEEELEDEIEEMEGMFGEMEEDWDDQEAALKVPGSVPSPPVKKTAKRKVTRDELTDALEKALEIDARRSERQEDRTAEDYGVDVEEEDITDRLDRLFGTLKSAIGGAKDAITFSRLVEQEDRQDRIDSFVNLMHLETEERVRCHQEEFLGEIEIEVLEEDLEGEAA